MSIKLMEQNHTSGLPFTEIQDGTLESLVRSFVLKMATKRSTILSQHGIAESDIEVLRYLATHEVKKMKELGDLFGLKFSTLTSTVDRLEDNRLVKRKGSKDDRRVVFVMIATRGRSLLQELTSLYTDVTDDFKSKLSGEPCAELKKALESINAQI